MANKLANNCQYVLMQQTQHKHWLWRNELKHQADLKLRQSISFLN